MDLLRIETNEYQFVLFLSLLRVCVCMFSICGYSFVIYFRHFVFYFFYLLFDYVFFIICQNIQLTMYVLHNQSNANFLFPLNHKHK